MFGSLLRSVASPKETIFKTGKIKRALMLKKKNIYSQKKEKMSSLRRLSPSSTGPAPRAPPLRAPSSSAPPFFLFSEKNLEKFSLPALHRVGGHNVPPWVPPDPPDPPGPSRPHPAARSSKSRRSRRSASIRDRVDFPPPRIFIFADARYASERFRKAPPRGSRGQPWHDRALPTAPQGHRD